MSKKYSAKAPLGIYERGGRVSVTRGNNVTHIEKGPFRSNVKVYSYQRLPLCTDADPPERHEPLLPSRGQRKFSASRSGKHLIIDLDLQRGLNNVHHCTRDAGLCPYP